MSLEYPESLTGYRSLYAFKAFTAVAIAAGQQFTKLVSMGVPMIRGERHKPLSLTAQIINTATPFAVLAASFHLLDSTDANLLDLFPALVTANGQVAAETELAALTQLSEFDWRIYQPNSPGLIVPQYFLEVFVSTNIALGGTASGGIFYRYLSAQSSGG